MKMKPRIGVDGDMAAEPAQCGPVQEGRGIVLCIPIFISSFNFLIGMNIGSSASCLKIVDCNHVMPGSFYPLLQPKST